MGTGCSVQKFKKPDKHIKITKQSQASQEFNHSSSSISQISYQFCIGEFFLKKKDPSVIPQYQYSKDFQIQLLTISTVSSSQDSNQKNLSNIQYKWNQIVSNQQKREGVYLLCNSKKQTKTQQQLSYKKQMYLQNANEKQIYYFYCKNQTHFLSLLEHGPPQQYRWAAWKIKIYQEDVYDPDLFEMLQMRKSPSELIIAKDMDRSFPDHVYFQKKDDDKQQSIGQKQLFTVLKAISNKFPNIGYTQGMNFIVGFSLMVNGGNLHDAFWFFVFLSMSKDFMLIGLFEDNFPLLQLLIYIFNQKLKQRHCKLYNHLEDIQLTDSMWIWKWFLTFFLYSFPLEFAVRLWDFIISRNIFAVITLALAFIQKLERKLLQMQLFDVSQFISDIKTKSELLMDTNSEFYISPDDLIQIAKSIKLTKLYLKEQICNYEKQTGISNKYTNYFININSEISKEQKSKSIINPILIPQEKENDVKNKYIVQQQFCKTHEISNDQQNIKQKELTTIIINSSQPTNTNIQIPNIEFESQQQFVKKSRQQYEIVAQLVSSPRIEQQEKESCNYKNDNNSISVIQNHNEIDLPQQICELVNNQKNY